MAANKEPLTSKKYVDGIYIPAGLLIFGTFIVKREWLPYAVVVTVALAALKFWRTRKLTISYLRAASSTSRVSAEVQPCLTTTSYRAQEGPQARHFPGIRAQGEDHPLS